MQTLKIKLENIFSKLKKFFLCKILGKKYIRSGKCNGCGRCCQSIYVRHAKQFIKTREEFERLKTLHYFYNYLKVVDETEDEYIVRTLHPT